MQLKELFAKNEKKPQVGSDYMGVVTAGLIPERGTIILTGEPKENEESMRELLPNKNEIHFYPDPEELTEKNKNEKIGKWKSEMIQKLGIEKFYEDTIEQAKIIREENPYCEVIHVKNEEEKSDGKLKFFVMSDYGEILDIAIHLSKVEGYEVKLCILDPRYEKIGDGIVEKEKDWHRLMGQGYIWVMDGCGSANLQDWLREQGEYVVGTNQVMSDHENDRQLGQKLFKEAGFTQPFSKNFTNIDEAIEFVKDNRDEQFILKQNGDLPKSINHKSHFDDNIDMIFHLEELKKTWSENTLGKFDVDIMTIVSGMEIAVSAFFNGHDFLRDKDGKVVGYLNFEYKKMIDGDRGPSTGEMGTIFYGTNEDNKLFSEIIMKPEIVAKLKECDYRGVFDINCIVTKGGKKPEIVALEATSRFGIPGASYEFLEAIKSDTGLLLETIAKGEDNPIEIQPGWGIVQVVVVPPFPLEADIEEPETSLGEKLWIIGKSGKPMKDFSAEQLKHIHLENFRKNDDGNYLVATKGGYLLTVTGVGKSIADARENILEYIKENIYITDFWYRSDIGKRTEKDLEKFSIE